MTLTTLYIAFVFALLWFGGVYAYHRHTKRAPRRIERVNVRGKEEWR